MIDMLLTNLATAPILFFALGVLAGLIRSDLSVPESISRYLSLYLMIAIGFKGGVAIANTAEFTAEVVLTAAAGMVFGLLQPFIAYAFLRLTSKLDAVTAAATAAHYGSISMVTFATAASFLDSHGIIYAGYIVAVLAMMEAPAIASGLFIAHRADPVHSKAAQTVSKLVRDVFTNGAIVLLTGAFVIGWITGEKGMLQLSAFIESPFQGFLCLFLLDMGLLVARNSHELKALSWRLIAFAIYMPLIGAALGFAGATLIGLDAGTGFLFVILCASSSYIAVPAAMRIALPEAKAAVYLPLSLAVTFPFNITVGIPLYYAAIAWLS